MSVWHEDTLTKLGATLKDLQIERFEDSGQLNLTVQDYFTIAKEVSSTSEDTFQIQVEWRTEDRFVGEAWREWRDAHAQVEIVQGPGKNFPSAFRDLVLSQPRNDSWRSGSRDGDNSMMDKRHFEEPSIPDMTEY